MPTSLDALVDELWTQAQAGDHFPAGLAGQLSLDQALDAQLGILDRKLAGGARLGGWKVGMTSSRARNAAGSGDVRPYGYILAEQVFTSGASLEAGRMRKGHIEPELCWTIGERLAGPVEPDRLKAAIARVAAGYELNENRRGSTRGDFPLLVADGLAQWGIVEGDGVDQPGTAAGFDVNATHVRLLRNGETVAEHTSRDVLDDHWESLRRLVETLSAHGRALEPGQKVITGAFTRNPIAPGETWRAEYSGLGAVEVSFT
ncbi:MAG: 2-keto-4-pentenoate hydratase [Acidimicrobiales bacterium]